MVIEAEGAPCNHLDLVTVRREIHVLFFRIFRPKFLVTEAQDLAVR